jgi:deoxyinosine 3'endonuclease (endonuclease V)
MGTLRHSWDVPVAEARAIQEALRDRVEERDRIGPLRRVAGADVSYDRGSPILYAAVVVLDADSLQTAQRLVLRMAPRWRPPEPVRAAHEKVNRLRREARGVRRRAPGARR